MYCWPGIDGVMALSKARRPTLRMNADTDSILAPITPDMLSDNGGPLQSTFRNRRISPGTDRRLNFLFGDED